MLRLSPFSLHLESDREEFFLGDFLSEALFDLIQQIVFLNFDFLGGTIAVGTALTGGPPHRSQRALLTHWAPTSGHDAQSLFGVRVQNTNRWKPAVGQTVHALPGHPVSLAPLP